MWFRKSFPTGVEGQKLLRKSSVVLVGVGGLGTFIAQYLVRAGVGRLRLIDLTLSSYQISKADFVRRR